MHPAMEEERMPSRELIALTIAPLIPLALIWTLTEGFSENPSLPPILSTVLPLALSLISAVVALFAFNLAKDEEPEWGPVLPFKLIEGLTVVYIVLSLLFFAIIVFIHFA